jgi:FeS assembly protein IscX
MAAELRWDDVEDIAIALADKYRNLTPLEVGFTDLRRYVIELPAFVDDPSASNEDNLEAIQMACTEPYPNKIVIPSAASALPLAPPILRSGGRGVEESAVVVAEGLSAENRRSLH